MHLSPGYNQRYGVRIQSRRKYRRPFLDTLQYWLEKEDSSLDKAVGYGICGFALIFMGLQVLRAIVG